MKSNLASGDENCRLIPIQIVLFMPLPIYMNIENAVDTKKQFDAEHMTSGETLFCLACISEYT